MFRREYKSSEKVEVSSSEDESLASPTLIERSPSPSSSVSSASSGPTSSALLSSSNSPTRTPTPDPSSYHYIPPITHELSTSKEKSALPNLRANEELYLLRIPKGAELRDIQFNFRKRKVRIGEEVWNLVDENTGDTRIIQPMENSEKFEFSMSHNCAIWFLGIETFARGLNIVRDVRIPSINEVVREETLKKKRKSDTAQVDHEKRRKHQDKHKEDQQKEKDKNKSKEKHHDKEKHRSREKSKGKESHTRGGKEGKDKSVKQKHKRS
jgi:hypothetical protein